MFAGITGVAEQLVQVNEIQCKRAYVTERQ